MVVGGNVFDGRVIFDHLPRSAGQAFNAWLRGRLGSACVSPNLIGNHQELIQNFGGKYSVISAHVAYAADGLDPRYKYITCLRDPVDRAISWLCFLLPHHGTDVPDEHRYAREFLDTEGQGNFPSAFLANFSNAVTNHFASILSRNADSDSERFDLALRGVEPFDVVGFVDAMPQFVADVAGLIGVEVPERLRRLNAAVGRINEAKSSAALRARIAELNTLDIEFYREVQSRTHRRPKSGQKVNDTARTRWVPFNRNERQRFCAPEFALHSATIEGAAFGSPGRVIEVKLEFSLAAAANELEAGVHIHDEFGRWAFGTNTTMLARPMLNVLPGRHELRFAFVADLPDGDYSIGFGFAQRDAQATRPLAWFDRQIEFRVRAASHPFCVGYARLPIEFDYRQTSNTPVMAIADARGGGTIEAEIGDVYVNECFELPLCIRNASSQVWGSTQVDPIHASYRWLSAAGTPLDIEAERTALMSVEIDPGCEARMRVRVIAPSAPGRYRLEISLLLAERGWFDTLGFAAAVAEINVRGVREPRYYPGADTRWFSQVGHRRAGSMESEGRAGFLLFGPYTYLDVGHYIVRVAGNFEPSWNEINVDVVCQTGARVLANAVLGDAEKAQGEIELAFNLLAPASDIEVRVWTGADVRASIVSVVIEPRAIDGGACK